MRAPLILLSIIALLACGAVAGPAQASSFYGALTGDADDIYLQLRPSAGKWTISAFVTRQGAAKARKMSGKKVMISCRVVSFHDTVARPSWNGRWKLSKPRLPDFVSGLAPKRTGATYNPKRTPTLGYCTLTAPGKVRKFLLIPSTPFRF